VDRLAGEGIMAMPVMIATMPARRKNGTIVAAAR